MVTATSLNGGEQGGEATEEASSSKDLSPALRRIPPGLMASQRLISKYGLPESPGLQSRHLQVIDFFFFPIDQNQGSRQERGLSS